MPRLKKAKYYSQMVKEASEGAFGLMMEIYKKTRPELEPSQLRLLTWDIQCSNLKEELYFNVFKIMHEADILAALDTKKVRVYLQNDEYDQQNYDWDYD